MIKIKKIINIILTLGLLIFIENLAFSEEKNKPKKELMTLEKILESKTIDNEYTKKHKAPVVFQHQEAHAAIACVECHHTKKFISCAECHQEKTVKETPKLMTAFHRNCKSCHKKLVKQARKENKESKAPHKCNQCHIKEK